jgi:allantoinase
MTTLLIAGGTLVDEQRSQQTDLLVVDGRIAALLEPGDQRTADTTLDATGRYLLPGLVDAHVHFNEPGRTEWEGFRTGTTAAAAGGITTVCDMPLNSHPPTLDARSLALKHGAVDDQALIDYALWGGLVPESLDHALELREGGVVGVKAFLCDSGLADYPPLDAFALLEAMGLCARHDLLLALHAEDAVETHRRGAAARAAGKTGPLDWARARPPSTEVSAVRTAIEMVAETGARVHFVHISTPEAARLIARARTAGLPVSVETCPHYLLLDETDLVRLGAFGKCAPPLRERALVDELWSAVFDRIIDWIASDHSPCPPPLKQTDDIWSAWGGLGGVQSLLPALLTEGVHGRGLPLPELVRLTSANPARALGLYPRKGALAVGSDADIAVVDLERRWTLKAEDLQTRWPGDPFVGRAFVGQVEATLVRGTLVLQARGGPCVEPGFGRFVRP